MKIYQETLMDHYKNPRNFGTLEHPDFSSGQFNPSCGDVIAVQGVVEGNLIKDIRFTGKGCVISQAAASLLTEKVKSKPINEALALNEEEIKKMVGIDLGPLRFKCALLSLWALRTGLKDYLGKDAK